MRKVWSIIRDNWKDAGKWFLCAVIGLLLGKSCNAIWPEEPVVVKEVSDTVKLVHSLSPLPNETDSFITERLEQQLLNIELLDKYDSYIAKKQVQGFPAPCKIILGNPYSNSKGYTLKSSSPFCYIEVTREKPFIDITYHFIRDDYVNMINTLGIKIYKKKTGDGRMLVLDQNYEPVNDGPVYIRIVDEYSTDEYSTDEYMLDAGFILIEDKTAQYPCYYSQSFPL